MSDPGAPTSRYTIVALVTSAGGLGALRAVLGALPSDFPAAVLVMQHLGRYGSALAEILAAHNPLPVAWVTDGVQLAPGQVWICPPQRMVDVDADGRCTLRAGMFRAMTYPIDALLTSLAGDGARRVLAAVLTGLGRDGAEGVRALSRAGGTVLTQSEASSEYPAMPRAAGATGLVDLDLPLEEIGPTIVRLVAGEPIPYPTVDVPEGAALFHGHGARVVGPRLAAVDWAATPLGPVVEWPNELCAALRLAFASHVPAMVHWGSTLVEFANDAALELCGSARHPAALGGSITESYAGPPSVRMLRDVLRNGRAGFAVQHRRVHRRASDVTTTVSCSAIWHSASPHGIGGVFTLVTERVAPVIAPAHP